MVEGKTNIGVLLREETWARFQKYTKKHTLRPGEYLDEIITKHLNSVEATRPETPKKAIPEVPVQESKAVSRVRRRLREDTEPEATKTEEEPGSVPERRQALDTVSLLPELVKYAEQFGIITEGKDEQALGVEVFDAIQTSYNENQDSKGWINANSAMLEWFNENMSKYPGDDDD